MSFALFIIYLLLTLVRPAEQIPALREWEVMGVASALALAAAALAVLTGRGPSFRAVQIPLMFAFLTWTAVSVAVSPLRSVSAFEDVLGLAKGSGTAFLLVILNVITARRLRVVAMTLTVSALFLAGQAVVEFRDLAAKGSQAVVGDLRALDSGSEWEDAQPQATDQGLRPDESARGFGIGLFGNPNDLALTLVAILPFSLALRRSRALLHNALLVWAPVGLITYGIYVTRSRGGVLAFACVLALSVRHRIGTTMSVLAAAGALTALLTLGFLGNRSMSIDQSAEGRIYAWSAGLQMLKSSPVWGVGLGMFTEYNPKAAHSSFVECFAELGLVGYLLWLGLIMLTLDDMRSTIGCASEDATELRRWARAVLVALTGFIVGGIFLSRSYDVLLFILLGLGTAVADLARRQGYLVRLRSSLQWSYLVSAVAGTSIIVLWLYMRLLR